MLVNIFLLIFTGTVLAMIFLCYIRGGMEPLLVMFFIGGLGITTMLFLGFLNTENQEEINYSDSHSASSLTEICSVVVAPDGDADNVFVPRMMGIFVLASESGTLVIIIPASDMLVIFVLSHLVMVIWLVGNSILPSA